MAHFHTLPFGWLITTAFAVTMAHAGTALAGDAALLDGPVDTGAILSDYSRRIRDAVEPEDVRRACNSLTGSYAAQETITVCGEAPGQNRYRVPREVAVAPKEQDLMTPVQRGRALMKAGDGGPVGNTGDLGGTGFNPLMFGLYGYKIVEKLIENAQEE